MKKLKLQFSKGIGHLKKGPGRDFQRSGGTDVMDF